MSRNLKMASPKAPRPRLPNWFRTKLPSGKEQQMFNETMGAFEVYPFNKATDDVATFVSQLTQKGKLISVAGGGDTISALKSTRSESKFSYISTAGGAFLEWIEGKKLPAIEALIN